MAHGMLELDGVALNRFPAWHNLGNVFANPPTKQEAIEATKTDWLVDLTPVLFKVGDEYIPVEDKNVIYRTDHNMPLGVVGGRYEPLQNQDVWDFVETFQAKTQTTIETGGTILNGRRFWVLLNAGTLEYVNGDPVQKYFMVLNSHDGSTAVTALFTDVRVVCQNTLALALRGTKHQVAFRHTKQIQSVLAEIDKAMHFRAKYDDAMAEKMSLLYSVGMTEEGQRAFLESTVFPAKEKAKKMIPVVPETVNLADAVESTDTDDSENTRGETIRQKNISQVLQLVEAGAGSDIEGVRGSAYGLFQAVVEHTDHVRGGRGDNQDENRFQSLVYGPKFNFKSQVLGDLLKAVA